MPHIALLLPLNSEAFGPAARMVEEGFMAAANVQPHNLPIRVYSSFDERADVVGQYSEAIADGAQAVVGPLTRDGVYTLATLSSIAVPTLALNILDEPVTPNLYYFGLPVETEARQVARIAASAQLHKATIIRTDTPLSTRVAQAFADEWQFQTGNPADEIVYDGDPAVLSTIPVEEDRTVFLATNAEDARLIHPYIDIALPVYAASRVFKGNVDTLTNYDLNNVKFVDMPWLLQPDHPAVMIYPRAQSAGGADMERLYALGIDAFRLLEIVLDHKINDALPLDGVTGRIYLANRQQFQREAVLAMFKEGRGMTPEQWSALQAERAAAEAAKKAGQTPTPPAVPSATTSTSPATPAKQP